MAPLEPDRRVGRWVLGGVAVALGLLGIAMRYGVGDPKTGTTPASFTLAAAGAAGALAGLPFSYLVRATAILALGTALMLLGADASGPLAGLRIGSTLPLELARLLALAVLPGALLFRARYRAYPKARVVLGLALIAAAPFAVSRGFVFASPGASLADEATAAADVAVILSGFFGFMGADTTGGGSVWASLVLGVLSSDIALRELGTSAGLGLWAEYTTTAVGTACAAILASMGVYHLLAASLAKDARRQMRSAARLELERAGVPSLSPGRPMSGPP